MPKPTIAQAQKTARKEATSILLDAARAYAHLWLAAGKIADKTDQWTSVDPMEEEKRLDHLLAACENFDQVITTNA